MALLLIYKQLTVANCPDVNELCALLPRERGGVALQSLAQQAENSGLHTLAVKGSTGDLRKSGCPAILRVRRGSRHHYLVMLDHEGARFLIVDPLAQVDAVSMMTAKELNASWTGEALFVASNLEDLPNVQMPAYLRMLSNPGTSIVLGLIGCMFLIYAGFAHIRHRRFSRQHGASP